MTDQIVQRDTGQDVDPGVIAEISRILAAHGQNIESQSLTTRGQLGYVVTDVGGPIADDALAELEAMPHTIRLRVLS